MNKVNNFVLIGIKRPGDALSSDGPKRQRTIEKIALGVKRSGESLSREDVKRRKFIEQADESTLEAFPQLAGHQPLEEDSEDELCHLLGIVSLSDLELMNQNTLETFMFKGSVPSVEEAL